MRREERIRTSKKKGLRSGNDLFMAMVGTVSRRRARLSWPAVDENLPKKIEIVQHLAGSETHRGQRIVRHGDGQAGLLPQAFVQVLEEGAAAGGHDPPVHHIR